ncbi:unnamed protein product [Lymnaea stagnalis]|uniref:Uncharacterized protein n=1 Tax=Lymnaea stagnalis TaxID=6523 RepID=A0AAV2IKW2_LYMST
MSRILSHVECLHSLVVLETVLDEEIDRLESEYDWDRQKRIYLQALECDRSHLVKLDHKILKCQELIQVYRKLLHDTFDEKLVLFDLVNSQHQKYSEISNTQSCVAKPHQTVTMSSCHYQADAMAPCHGLPSHLSPCQCLPSLADDVSSCPHKSKSKHSNNYAKHFKQKYETSKCFSGIRTFNTKKIKLHRNDRRSRILNSARRRQSIHCGTKKYHYRHQQTYSRRRALKYSYVSSRQQKPSIDNTAPEQKSSNNYKAFNCPQHDLYRNSIPLSSSMFTINQGQLSLELYRLDDPRSEPISLEVEDPWRQQEMERDNRLNRCCLRCSYNSLSWEEFLFDEERD